jgi:hypothetical protein
MMTPRNSSQCIKEREQSPVQESNRSDFMHEILLMIIPLAAPYIAGYIQKFMGSIQSEESD